DRSAAGVVQRERHRGRLSTALHREEAARRARGVEVPRSSHQPGRVRQLQSHVERVTRENPAPTQCDVRRHEKCHRYERRVGPGHDHDVSMMRADRQVLKGGRHPRRRGGGVLGWSNRKPRRVGCRIPLQPAAAAPIHGQELLGRAHTADRGGEGERWGTYRQGGGGLTEVPAGSSYDDEDETDGANGGHQESAARTATRSSSASSDRQAYTRNASALAPNKATRGIGGTVRPATIATAARTPTAA